MRALAAVVILTGLGGTAAGQEPEAATPVNVSFIHTLITALDAREANLPPLNLVGIWRGYYTPLHWKRAEVILGEEGFARVVKGDRAAVGIALWEGPDRREWQREFQGLYRGPCNWVYPGFPADPLVVSDMYRLECGYADHVVTLDRAINDFPWITLRPLEQEKPYEFIRSCLGLGAHGGPLGEDFRSDLKTGRRRLSGLTKSGSQYTLSMIWYEAEPLYAGEMVVTLDESVGFAPVRLWYFVAKGPNSGHGEVFEWEDLRRIGESDVFLPASCTNWEFQYRYPELGALDNTKRFDCLELGATEPGSERPRFPRCALVEDLGVLSALPPSIASCRGVPMWRMREGFAKEVPPEPPSEMLELDLEARLYEIREAWASE